MYFPSIQYIVKVFLEALTKLDSRFRGNDMSGRDARVPRIA